MTSNLRLRRAPRVTVVSRAHRSDFMGHGVALDDQPHAATVDVVPGFRLHAANVFAQKNRIVPFVHGRIECRVIDAGVAAVGELGVIAFAAERDS